MAKFIPDPPKSNDAEAQALLRLNQQRTRAGREKSNGSVAVSGSKVADSVGVSGGSQ